MNMLKGINTGVINSANGVPVIALKIIDSGDSEQLLLLPPDQLQEVMFALFSCYRSLHRIYQQSPDQIREQVNANSQTLSTNVPAISLDEVQSISAERCVTNFVLKQRQDRINFLFLLQNDENLLLALDYTQIEYVLSLLANTIQNAGNEQLMALCLTMNDFIPLYVTTFNKGENEGIDYNQFSVPDWKSETFDTFHSILFIQPDGAIACGAIIKAEPAFPAGRIEFIAQILLQNNKMLVPYKNHTMIIDHTRLDIPVGDESMEKLLRAHIAHRTKKLG